MLYLHDEMAAKIPTRTLDLLTDTTPRHTGRGSIGFRDGAWVLSAPPTHNDWASHNCPPDGDYCNFGACTMVIDMGGRDLSAYNRLTFFAFAVDTGIPAPMLYCGIRSSGKQPIPDVHGRTGTHQASLVTGQWCEVIWEFPELCADHCDAITISMPLNGDFGRGLPDTTVYIRDVALSHIAHPEPCLGWACGEEIAYAYAGYPDDGNKTAVTQIPCETFTLLDRTAGTEQTLPAKQVHLGGQTCGQTYYLLDFSAVTACGRYALRAGTKTTGDFPILSRRDYNAALTQKLLTFISAERCGCDVPGRHPVCHADIVAEHNGIVKSYHGGWHDAGDLSQQTLQSGETALALLRIAARTPALSAPLADEARWGMDFVLAMRFGDGYRATSAGITRWTDGVIGTMDDCTARVHNHAFENYRFSGIEAEAAMAETDPARRDALAAAAIDDFRYAEERYAAWGRELPIFFEHSYSSPRSLYAAAAIAAAGALYRLSGDCAYLTAMHRHANVLLACQMRSSDAPITGYFCRDEQLTVPVHFTHQSREYLYGEALAALLTAPLDAETHCRVIEAAVAYIGYYKQLYQYASPYGMLPAGVYALSETDDTPENREIFSLCHLFADFDASLDAHRAQITAGTPLGGGMYVKQFPVWFSFRGNNAIFLSQAASLRALAGIVNDTELTAMANTIADRQTAFVLGCNPFRQSMVYAYGARCAEPYFALLGRCEGAVPVGIQTDADGDEPFWPCGINATYKEVWLSAATALLRNM